MVHYESRFTILLLLFSVFGVEGNSDLVSEKEARIQQIRTAILEQLDFPNPPSEEHTEKVPEKVMEEYKLLQEIQHQEKNTPRAPAHSEVAQKVSSFKGNGVEVHKTSNILCILA